MYSSSTQCLILRLALIPCYIFIIQASIVILGSLTKRITCTTINTRDKRHKEIFLRETIKEKTPQLPLRQNQHQNSKRSPKTAVVFCLLSSPKISSSVESPNFRIKKLKMLRIKFCFDRKMCPSMESQPSILLLMNCGERPKK